MLGEPSSGKSALSAALLRKNGDDLSQSSDFAIGYEWADVRDDADEGIFFFLLRHYVRLILRTVRRSGALVCVFSALLSGRTSSAASTFYPSSSVPSTHSRDCSLGLDEALVIC